jgi:hypothetical protein
MLGGDLLLLVYARSLLHALTRHVPALGVQLDDLKEGSAVSVLTACQERLQVLRIKAAPACLEPLLSVLPTLLASLPRLRKIVLVCGVYFPDLFAGQQGPEAAPLGMPEHLLQDSWRSCAAMGRSAAAVWGGWGGGGHWSPKSGGRVRQQGVGG